jgi:hypothetical protein
MSLPATALARDHVDMDAASGGLATHAVAFVEDG